MQINNITYYFSPNGETTEPARIKLQYLLIEIKLEAQLDHC